MKNLSLPMLRPGNEPILAGRLTGKRAFVTALEALPEMVEPTLVLLDFRNVDFATSSFLSEVVLPLRYQAHKAGKPVTLKLLAEFGVCKEICVLREERLTLTINPGEGPAAALIERFRADVPGNLAAAGLEPPALRLKEGKLLLRFGPQAGLQAPDIFVEGPAEYWFGKPKLLPQGDGGLELALPYTPAAQPPVLGGLRFTLVDGRRSAEFTP